MNELAYLSGEVAQAQRARLDDFGVDAAKTQMLAPIGQFPSIGAKAASSSDVVRGCKIINSVAGRVFKV